MSRRAGVLSRRASLARAELEAQGHAPHPEPTPAEPARLVEGLCVTGKLRYPSAANARTAGRQARLSHKHLGQQDGLECALYRCRRCRGGWHVTSDPLITDTVEFF